VHGNYAEHKGKTYTVNGQQSLTLNEIVELMEVCWNKKATRSSSIGLGDFFWHFWRGCSHDRNMKELARFYKNNAHNFKTHDFFAETGLEPHHRLACDFFEQKHDLQMYATPNFLGYKSVTLD
jgi:hypothetical protein